MGFTGPLPNNFLERMSPEDRKPLGKAGQTISEATAKNSLRLEREIHRGIANELLRRNIVFIHSRTDKKATIGVGLPDFCMAIGGIPVALEVKLPGETLGVKQAEVRNAMVRNGWDYYVVYSLKEAVDQIIRYSETRRRR